MNCDRLRRALAFEDTELALDPSDARAHFASCAACRREHADVARLYGIVPSALAAPVQARKLDRVVSAARLAAAAALVLVATWLANDGRSAACTDAPAAARSTAHARSPTPAGPARAVAAAGGVTRELTYYAAGRARTSGVVVRDLVRAGVAAR